MAALELSPNAQLALDELSPAVTALPKSKPHKVRRPFSLPQACRSNTVCGRLKLKCFRPTPTDLLDYKMTDEAAQQTNLYNIVLSDYSTSGEHAGYGVADFAHLGDTNRQYWLWETDNIGLTNALHFNGSNTQLTATNSAAAINFTTNAFTINVWLNAYGYDSSGSNEYRFFRNFPGEVYWLNRRL